MSHIFSPLKAPYSLIGSTVLIVICSPIFFPPMFPAGLAMSQIELEKIADHFDRDKDGYIDLSEISSILRGLRRARSLAKKQPISDSEKIDYEVAVIELSLQLPALFMSSQMKFQTLLALLMSNKMFQLNFLNSSPFILQQLYQTNTPSR